MRLSLLVTSSALIYEDCAQTVAFRREGFSERNPLLGRTPSTERVLATCAVGLGLNYVAWRKSRWLTAAVIVAEVVVVGWNLDVAEGTRAMHVGLRWRL